jgi:hypothetical protein
LLESDFLLAPWQPGASRRNNNLAARVRPRYEVRQEKRSEPCTYCILGSREGLCAVRYGESPMNLADQESGTLDLKVDRPFSVSSPTSDTVVLVSALKLNNGFFH